MVKHTKPDMSKVPGGWETEDVPNLSSCLATHSRYLAIGPGDPFCRKITRIFNYDDCNYLIDLMERAPGLQPVSVQGRTDVPDERIGSRRATIWSEKLAEIIWRKLDLDLCLDCNPFTSTDWWQGDKRRWYWKAVGFSPLLRFMRYEKGGMHYPHYDAGYIYPDDNYRTLMSVVLYLTDNKSGFTRMIQDNQEGLPVWDRDHSDWIREPYKKEILSSSVPTAGNGIIFNHRICHDVSLFTDEKPRIIIRGDVIFKSL